MQPFIFGEAHETDQTYDRRYQHERGNSQDIKPFLTLALAICKRNPGLESAQLMADIYYGLAAAANETNDGNACLHTEQLLRLRLEAATDEVDIRLAIAYNEYGIALVMNGEYDKAIAAFENSIAVYQRLADYWPAMATNPRTNMGFTYWVLRKLGPAEKILQDLLSDREAKFGVNDRESYRYVKPAAFLWRSTVSVHVLTCRYCACSTGRVYHGIGNIYYDRGLFKASERWHQRALSHYQDTLGSMHHKTADLCHRVAQHSLRRGEMSHARWVLHLHKPLGMLLGLTAS